MNRRTYLRVLIACCVVLLATPVVGQEPLEYAELAELDEIETDRDSFTPATSVPGCGRLVAEAAHSFIDNRSVPDTHSFPELLVRYGISNWLELRLGWNYEVGGAGSVVSGNVPDDFGEEDELEREHTLLYGLKAWITEQDAWLPESALIVQGFTPTGGEETDTHLSATYVCGWTLSNRWVWDSAFRYSTGSLEADRFDVWAPATVLKIPLGERWKVHPIADWSDRDVYRYLKEHGLPYHPLWEQGYISVGDVHTTKPIHAVTHADETRFFGLKRECGLHDIDLSGL